MDKFKFLKTGAYKKNHEYNKNMENNINDPDQNLTFDIKYYILLSEFRKPLFKLIINSLNLPNRSKGLDVGCGIGFYTEMLADSVGENGVVFGVDLSEDYINYANKNKRNTIKFEVGDINSLRYDDNYFDWIWGADTVWPGPRELGCPNEIPTPIIKDFYRILKPGGEVFILFYSTQKFLSGYPLLEAHLNTTSGATAPFIDGMDPIHHIMNAKHWLSKAGFKDISAKTFLADINSPLDKKTKDALFFFFDMLWGESENQLPQKDWEKYTRLCNPNSKDNILNNQHYYGFYTYTLFRGKK